MSDIFGYNKEVSDIISKYQNDLHTIIGKIYVETVEAGQHTIHAHRQLQSLIDYVEVLMRSRANFEMTKLKDKPWPIHDKESFAINNAFYAMKRHN